MEKGSVWASASYWTKAPWAGIGISARTGNSCRKIWNLEDHLADTLMDDSKHSSLIF